MRIRTALLTVFIFIVPAECMAAPRAEATPAVSPTTEEKGEEAAPIDIATPTPVPTVDTPTNNGDVEPLDSWYVVPKTTATPEGAATPQHDKGVDKLPVETKISDTEEEEDDVAELESVETGAQLPESVGRKSALDTALKPRRIQLTKIQKQRIRAARIVRHKIMTQLDKDLGIIPPVMGDTRGEPELRACTVNLNGYGTVEDFRRIFKKEQLPRRVKGEASALTAITNAKCDIVAVQNVLGVTDTSAALAMKQFLRKLTARLGGEWEAVLGHPKRDLVRNGFLVRTDRMTIKKQSSFEDVSLTAFGAFKLKEFGRPPLLLLVEVPGKEKAKPRRIMFLTYDFRYSNSGTTVEPETNRMQMADGLRQIIHTEEQGGPGEPTPEEEEAVQPMVVLLGDRTGPQPAPATQLLEGRLRLIDFTQNGGCTLTPENKVECKSGKPVHLKEFFGVSTEGYVLTPKVKTKKEEDTEKRVLVYPSESKEKKIYRAEREKQTEIYLRAADLTAAQVNMFFPGRYKAGTMVLNNGLKDSPLVWVELNW